MSRPTRIGNVVTRLLSALSPAKQVKAGRSATKQWVCQRDEAHRERPSRPVPTTELRARWKGSMVSFAIFVDSQQHPAAIPRIQQEMAAQTRISLKMPDNLPTRLAGHKSRHTMICP
ncbi:hypothetical protein PFICI_13133 [Pestalotiopsis fici W106-1]|uniref:Uncharacterized protein n=1 Tax=Pestalotiopsis fici (strain W106-1 / CGMCC3.15140) TaxID=1229662 RepID=W3WLJ9_PESFW|nr:uncharacterized protein PFICI_13133 [Pestalotiopsis fici W106-1]ETS74649.1 hypothetical protein PFICI_13133 [Pestalotiopsis fici W106-1]